jgi:hypothetical protein
MLTIVTLTILTTLMIGPAYAQPSDPYDYPWCIRGENWGYPGYCEFVSYEQCLATAWGPYSSYCWPNPRFLFAPNRWQNNDHRSGY